VPSGCQVDATSIILPDEDCSETEGLLPDMANPEMLNIFPTQSQLL
jgi:hypothetical protein